MSKSIRVEKMSGEMADFDESRLRRSLERSGAAEKIIEQVVKEVNELLYNGITTKEIYKKAFALLKKSSRPTAARYKLKKAIMELGPSGYPFEKFVGEILSRQGYKTKTDILVMGNCVQHEVDVIAEKDDQYFMVECKFHNTQGRFCDVKIPLYIQSRFKDIEKEWLKDEDHQGKHHQGWVVTNTRFTEDALQFGSCVGLNLIGWDYPKVGSLKDRINIAGLHPITCLTTLTSYEKNQLLKKNLVMCTQICKNPNILKEIGINEKRHNKILDEARDLCGKDIN